MGVKWPPNTPPQIPPPLVTKNRLQLDCADLTYQQMADVVRSIGLEVNRRNPRPAPLVRDLNDVGVLFVEALCHLQSTVGGEIGNPTSECGPEEKRHV